MAETNDTVREEAIQNNLDGVNSGSDTKSNAGGKKPAKKRLKQIIAIIVGVAACIILIAPSIAGYLNVSVISTSGQFTGIDCEVELYEGDVVALLVDADPFNDPEPIKSNQIVVGQRTTFNGMNFGTYTMNVKLLDEQAAAQVSITPRTTTMWGIDNRQTYEIA